MIDWDGLKLTVTEAATMMGIPRATLAMRLSRGWSLDEALFRRPQPRHRSFRHLLTQEQRLAYDRIRKDASQADTLRAIGRSDLVKS